METIFLLHFELALIIKEITDLVAVYSRFASILSIFRPIFLKDAVTCISLKLNIFRHEISIPQTIENSFTVELYFDTFNTTHQNKKNSMFADVVGPVTDSVVPLSAFAIPLRLNLYGCIAEYFTAIISIVKIIVTRVLLTLMLKNC